MEQGRWGAVKGDDRDIGAVDGGIGGVSEEVISPTHFAFG